MTPDLELWLKQATRCLSSDSAAQVRREISEHYESARENATARGETPGQADRTAIAALGRAKVANRQYRKVLLLASEERVLRAARWESRTFGAASGGCRLGLRWAFRLVPVALASIAVAAFAMGNGTIARMVLAVAIAVGIFFAVPTFPIYTPTRARIYRYVKWAGVIGAAAFLNFPGWSGMVLSVGGYFASLEIVNHSIRRKLPVADWPKTLYL